MKDINTLLAENDSAISVLYGSDASLRERIKNAVESFTAIYGEQDYSVFSVSGRSEICGNHTDHQHGKVLAASINLDIIAIASTNNSNIVKVVSNGYDMISIDG